MRQNANLTIEGNVCKLVPYRPEHVPHYHKWMVRQGMESVSRPQGVLCDDRKQWPSPQEPFTPRQEDPHLQEATASEPLIIEEEYEMQKSWCEDEKSALVLV